MDLGDQAPSTMHATAAADQPVPWRVLAPVLVPAVAIVAAVILMERFAHAPASPVLLDNVHWTV
ncbi:MAG: hypothetical protein HZA61_04470 [Candidatus Eisenbacteria bacterium]|uniref:Uncharacterized protein n=1 Tax=Eiseniibacteriota bacterium TaxID=2212470 RepID=A0A933SCG1_UNCEI|nr:hypothetical protein [Candidatus Eisenbacteria bacterium]